MNRAVASEQGATYALSLTLGKVTVNFDTKLLEYNGVHRISSLYPAIRHSKVTLPSRHASLTVLVGKSRYSPALAGGVLLPTR